MTAHFSIVQLVALDETGDSYYRMRWPARSVAAQEPAWSVLSIAADASERIAYARSADLLILYQCADLELLPIIHERTRRGLKTLVEYNDNFYAPQPWSPVAKEWSSPLLWQRYEQFMDLADGVIVTGVGLYNLFSARIPAEKIYILENHLYTSPPSLNDLRAIRTTTKRADDEVTLGWAGSLGHMADLLAIAPTIAQILNRYPRCTFCVMGNEAIPDLLKFPPHQLRYTPWGTMEQYYNFWKQVDIGIAPLLDTPYNRCRSDIKAVEMASRGVLPLLPKLLPYEQFTLHTNLPSFTTFEELSKLLTRAIEDSETRNAEVTTAYEYVARERVAITRTERRDLYSRFLPVQPTTQHPTHAPGAHEITGTAQHAAPHSGLLAQIKQLMHERRFDVALAQITASLKESAEDHELAYIRCVLLEHTADSERISYAARCAENFPRDLRFQPALLSSTATAEEWSTLFKKFEEASTAERIFFAPHIERRLIVSLQSDPALLPIAQQVLRLYPPLFELQFIVGEHLRNAGDNHNALTHFRYLKEAKDIPATSLSFLTRCEYGYLTAWYEALTARVRGTL